MRHVIEEKDRINKELELLKIKYEEIIFEN